MQGEMKILTFSGRVLFLEDASVLFLSSDFQDEPKLKVGLNRGLN